METLFSEVWARLRGQQMLEKDSGLATGGIYCCCKPGETREGAIAPETPGSHGWNGRFQSSCRPVGSWPAIFDRVLIGSQVRQGKEITRNNGKANQNRVHRERVI